MIIIYAAPFILLSIICYSISSVVPRIRRYALKAAIAPVAFGICSIVGMFVILFLSDHVSALHTAAFDQMWDGAEDSIIDAALYFVPGALGAWAAVCLTGTKRHHI
jgi:uncharacterized membrane protein